MSIKLTAESNHFLDTLRKEFSSGVPGNSYEPQAKTIATALIMHCDRNTDYRKYPSDQAGNPFIWNGLTPAFCPLDLNLAEPEILASLGRIGVACKLIETIGTTASAGDLDLVFNQLCVFYQKAVPHREVHRILRDYLVISKFMKPRENERIAMDLTRNLWDAAKKPNLSKFNALDKLIVSVKELSEIPDLRERLAAQKEEVDKTKKQISDDPNPVFVVLGLGAEAKSQLASKIDGDFESPLVMLLSNKFE